MENEETSILRYLCQKVFFLSPSKAIIIGICHKNFCGKVLLTDAKNETSFEMNFNTFISFLIQLNEILKNLNSMSLNELKRPVFQSISNININNEQVEKSVQKKLIKSFIFDESNVGSLKSTSDGKRIVLENTQTKDKFFLFSEELKKFQDLQEIFSNLINQITFNLSSVKIFYDNYLKRCNELNVKKLDKLNFFSIPNIKNCFIDFFDLFYEIPIVIPQKQIEREIFFKSLSPYNI